MGGGGGGNAFPSDFVPTPQSQADTAVAAATIHASLFKARGSEPG